MTYRLPFVIIGTKLFAPNNPLTSILVGKRYALYININVRRSNLRRDSVDKV